MRIIRSDSNAESFTRVPNALFLASLTPAMERAWIRLASLDHGDYSRSYRNLESIAEAIGYNRSALFRVMKDLKDAGFLAKNNDDLHLFIPSGPFEKKTKKPVQSVELLPENIPSISEELAAEPKRVNSMSEKEAKTLFLITWNKFKPESYLEERSLNPATWIAIELQAKRLKVSREDYEIFVKTICLGLKADEWWASKSFRPSNIFGYSANIEDKKFQSVEKLYKQGQTKEARSAAFSGSKLDFLEWYNSKGFPVQTIEAHEVADWNEGQEKEQELLTRSKTVDRSVARVYYAKGKPVFWSGKMNQSSLYYLP